MRTAHRIVFALACLPFGSGFGALADVPTEPLDVADESPPTFSVYSSRDGLSDEIWSTIGFDKLGFVWAGSASSLARFDGYRWMDWPLPQARSLVRDMDSDRNGILWAIFEREGLASYDGKSWSLLAPRGQFHQRFSPIRSANGSQDLWLSTDSGFRHLNNGQWQDDPGNASVHLGPTARIEQTETLSGRPRQWMGTTIDGLWYREFDGTRASSTWRRFEAPGFDALHVTDLLRTYDGANEELWIVTYGDGLWRIRNDGVRVWRAASGELPSEAIYSALATYSAQGQRSLWLATRAGLLRFRNDRIAVFDRRNGLPSNAVRGIKLQRNADGTELLWLATEGGIARTALTSSQWLTVSLLGVRENGTFTVLVEPDGHGGERLWIGSAGAGLGLLENGEWRYFTRENGALPAAGVRQMWRLPDASGRLQRVLSLTDGRIMRLDDELKLSPLDTPWPPGNDQVALQAISRNHEGRQESWFAHQQLGIFRNVDGHWTQFLAEGVRQPWSVSSLAEQVDANGRSWLWAASNQGLAVFDGTAWRLIPGLPIDSFRDVTPMRHTARPTLWAASSRNGLLRLDVSDPLHPVLINDGRVPAPPDPTVYTIREDSQGRIYVCTNNGVQMLTLQADQHYAERVFRRRDGLVHDECNTNAQIVDAHDRYWVGTLGGLSVYDPNIQTATRQSRPKPLRFTSLNVDGKALDAESDAAIHLPAGTHEIDIAFAVLSGLREQESTYRSQLMGLEAEPGPWTAEHQRRFNRLPPGSYVLNVQARDYAGTSSQPLSLSFSVAANWWERRPIQFLGGVIGLLLVSGLVLLYNRGLRMRQRHLKREVARRTLEIRAANQRLTELSYRDPLTGVANRRRLTEALDAAIERSISRSLPIGLIVIDVDHFKQYNDRHGHLAGDAALRAVAQALASVTREQDLVARFGGEEFACLMIDADIDVVARCAERMRVLIEALPPRALGNAMQTITISVGVTSRIPVPGDRGADLLHETDAALYRAKHEGRNCVRRADERDSARPQAAIRTDED